MDFQHTVTTLPQLTLIHRILILSIVHRGIKIVKIKIFVIHEAICYIKTSQKVNNHLDNDESDYLGNGGKDNSEESVEQALDKGNDLCCPEVRVSKGIFWNEKGWQKTQGNVN